MLFKQTRIGFFVTWKDVVFLLGLNTLVIVN